MSLLQVNDIGVVYPDGTVALKSISFSAREGEIIGVIGKSGAGKSTLLRCLNGLQKPTSGNVYFDGEEISFSDERNLNSIRCKIGFIWQEYNLLIRLSAMKNVLIGRLGHNSNWSNSIGYFGKTHREVACHNLNRVNMLGRAHLRADRLSGGEKQRISIARALSQEPKLILADEPVASLDPDMAWVVMSDLERVAREDNVLAIVNLHQVDLVKKFCDRILGIAQGRIVFDDSPLCLDDAAMDEIYRFDRARVKAAV